MVKRLCLALGWAGRSASSENQIGSLVLLGRSAATFQRLLPLQGTLITRGPHCFSNKSTLHGLHGAGT
jgi:hypothetical protein